MICEIRTYIGTRQIQEDAAGYCITEKGLFSVVCDGVGSREKGAESSQMAVQLFIEKFQTSTFENYPNFIINLASEIDEKIFQAYKDKSGTTAVTAYISQNELYWFSVGDSRLYILRKGRLKQITTDHNYSYVLSVRKNKQMIDPETYQKELSKGNQLVSFMGMGGIDLVDLNFQPFLMENNDLLLLTTDGLYNALSLEQIGDILGSTDALSNVADLLIEAVKKCETSLDNTTFALIKY